MYLDLQSHLAYGPGGPVAILAPTNFLASVLGQGRLGGGESHHDLAHAYLRGILGVLRFDRGWAWALGSLSCCRSSCSYHLQCFGGPGDVLRPLPEGDAISRTIPVTGISPSLGS